MNPLNSILRSATRKPTDKLNILTFPTHERYETNLAQTGHNFYSLTARGIKNWNTTYAKIPPNYHIFDLQTNFPTHVDFDLVLSQNKFGQYQIASKLSSELHLPLLSLEHTLPYPGWPDDMVKNMTNMRGDVNVFISDYSIDEWGFKRNDSLKVIKHCVDSELFKYNGADKKSYILSVVNDWVNRDVFCNFRGWERITSGLPVRVVGDNQGLSKPAASIEDLVNEYSTAKVFLNTSTISPIPSVLLEAMSCGCAVVSTATCMIPEIIKNGVNGFISNDETQLKEYCELLLKDDGLCQKLGEEARKTIITDFSSASFIQNWNDAFNQTIKYVYVG